MMHLPTQPNVKKIYQKHAQHFQVSLCSLLLHEHEKVFNDVY